MLPRDLLASQSLLDTRPNHEVLSRAGGVRNVREWGLPEDGSEDTSRDLMQLIHKLDDYTMLTFPPASSWRLDALPIKISGHRGLTIDGAGARFFSSVRREYELFNLVENEHLTMRRMNVFGYRKDTTNGSGLTNVAGTPTVSGTTKLLDALDESVRIPQQTDGFTFTPWYARDKDGLNRFEATLSDSAQVVGDCVITVSGLNVDESVETVLSTTTLTLTAVPTLYTVTLTPTDLDQRLKLTIKKATATANTITVTSASEFGKVGYTEYYAFSAGFRVERCTDSLLEDLAVEGVGGDAIQASDADVHRLTAIRPFSRCCFRQGMSFNRGSNFVIESPTVMQAGQSGIDVEPGGPDWFVRDVHIRDAMIRDSYHYMFAIGNWARIFELHIDGVRGSSRLGLGLGGSRGGSMRGVVMDQDHGSSNIFRLSGIGFRCRDLDIAGVASIEAGTSTFDDGTGSVTFTSNDNEIDGLVVDSEQEYAQAVVKEPTSRIRNVTIRNRDAFAQTSNGAGPFQFAGDSYRGLLDPGRWATEYPGTFRGVASKSLWYPRGMSVLDEPVLQARALSARGLQGNNLRGIAVPIAEAATTGTVVFPSRPIQPFSSYTRAATTGGSLPNATYFYRLAARTLYGGPYPTAAMAEVSIALSGGNNAVNHTLQEWALPGDLLLPGFTLWRGTSAGVYDTRFDVLPSEDFYSPSVVSMVFKDIGNVLVWGSASADKVWGWPANTAGRPGVESLGAGAMGYGLTASTNPTPVTMAVPPRTKVGTVMLMLVAVNGARTIATPSGWALVSGAPWSSGASGNDAKIYAFTRTRTAADADAFTVATNSATYIRGVIIALDGANTTTPVQVAGSASVTSGVTVTAPSVTSVTTPANRVISIFASKNGAAGDMTWVTGPLATELARSSPAGPGMALLVAEELQNVAGATTARTATVDVLTGAVGVTLAVQPATGLSHTVADESGWEPDAGYGVLLTPRCATAWGHDMKVTAQRRDGFDYSCVAAPAAASFDWFVVR